ncbi:MAG: hypothetical protein EPO22_01545, partial [Dehalococcoidia bacterium]
MSSFRPRQVVIVFFATMLLLASTAGVTSAAPGDLDPTFDGDGIVITNMGGGPGVPLSQAIQGDGKIVGATSCNGTVFDFCLARYNTDGSLDTTFDGDGKVLTDIAGGFDEAWGVAIQADGRIVAGGACGPNSYQTFCLARYNTDGSLDTTFDGDGKVTTDILGNSATGNVGGAKGRDLVLQSDGKIVLVGFCGAFNQFFTVLRDACLARYNTDGSLDSTFSGDG